MNRKNHSRRDKCRRDATAVALFIGLGIMMFGCSSSTWEDAQQTDTYEAYQTYIDDNPGASTSKKLKNGRMPAIGTPSKLIQLPGPLKNILTSSPGDSFRQRRK